MNVYGELLRAQLHLSASDLTPTATGLVYFNTTTGPKWYNGSDWLLAADTTTSQVFTNKDYDGGTASDTSRLTVPKASKATLDALTRKEGTIVYGTDTDKLYADDGTTLVTIGSSSGAGELNAVLNASAGDNLTGWTDGTSHTTTRLTSGSPLDPVITTALSTSATTTATESSTSGVKYSIATMPTSLLSKKLKVEFYFTTEASQTWAVSVYASTTRLALSSDSSGATTLPAGTTGKFVAYFDTSTATAYSVNLTRTAGSGTAVLKFTSVIVGPGIQPQGAVVTPVQVHTPTIGGLGTGSVVSGTTDFFYYRSGQSMIAWGGITKDGSAGTGTADVTMTLPSGLTIDLNYLTESSSVSSSLNRLGPWNIRNSAGKYGFVYPSSTTVLRFARADTSVSQLQGDDVGSGATITFGPLIIPISEWAGSGTLNTAQNDVEYVSHDGTSNIYGPQGALVPNQGFTTGDTNRTVTFLTPPQVTDTVTVELLDVASGKWFNAAQFSPYFQGNNANSNNHYGIRSYWASATTYTVSFGNQGLNVSSTTANNGNSAWSTEFSAGTRFRVVKTKAGVAVGFGLATSTQSGLVPNGGPSTTLSKSELTDYISLTNDAGTATSVGRWKRVGNLVFITIRWNTISISGGVAFFSFTLPSSVPAPISSVMSMVAVYDNSGSVVTTSTMDLSTARVVTITRPSGTFTGGANTSYLFGQIIYTVD